MEIAVLGLGNFGANLCQRLHELGHRVTAVDLDSRAVSQVQQWAEQAVVGDATDRVMLEEMGVNLMSYAVVSLGDDMGASILATLQLRELGLEEVVAKAISPEHEKILARVGATRVVFPERDAAQRLAMSISDPNVVDYLPLGGDYSVAEVTAPDGLVGHTLQEVDLRAKYNVSVIAVRENGAKTPKVVISPDYRFARGDVLLVLGRQDDLEKLRAID